MIDPEKYAPVLERMVELLGSNENMTFGDALDQAASELGITVPGEVLGVLLTSVFSVITCGRIHGAPDA